MRRENGKHEIIQVSERCSTIDESKGVLSRLWQLFPLIFPFGERENHAEVQGIENVKNKTEHCKGVCVCAAWIMSRMRTYKKSSCSRGWESSHPDKWRTMCGQNGRVKNGGILGEREREIWMMWNVEKKTVRKRRKNERKESICYLLQQKKCMKCKGEGCSLVKRGRKVEYWEEDGRREGREPMKAQGWEERERKPLLSQSSTEWMTWDAGNPIKILSESREVRKGSNFALLSLSLPFLYYRLRLLCVCMFVWTFPFVSEWVYPSCPVFSIHHELERRGASVSFSQVTSERGLFFFGKSSERLWVTAPPSLSSLLTSAHLLEPREVVSLSTFCQSSLLNFAVSRLLLPFFTTASESWEWTINRSLREFSSSVFSPILPSNEIESLAHRHPATKACVFNQRQPRRRKAEHLSIDWLTTSRDMHPLHFPFHRSSW